MRIILWALALVLLSGCIQYSSGDRVGVVVKFSEQGLFAKTWEGELAVGGNGTVVQQPWHFCVTDPAVIAKVATAQEAGHRTKLHYQEEWIVAPWRCEHSDYFVTRVEVLAQ